ncbi:COX assembly mitochondrial protein homolog [Chelonus insularis]|uniref:COX assembly mitochondrial protein homolog n=1 Tax=Chelonus insularis TaxID=460826 RepID=UPI0015884F02|nr:COX assembly mitochondrial protein homolog [Chelonus insularis]
MKDCGEKMAATMAEHTRTKKTVLSSKLSGGPHGYGDPDDLSLRKVETNILIPDKVREKSRKIKCIKEVEAFNKCGKEAKLAVTFKCTEERDKLVKCLDYWFHDAQLNEECKQEYLRERSEFRRTGVGVKNPKS